MRSQLMDIDITIQGGPCTARLHSVTPGFKGDRETPPEAPGFDFSVLDGNGRQSDWLKENMSHSEHEAVCEQFQQGLDDAESDARYEAHQAMMDC